jgi:hypothetical protein
MRSVSVRGSFSSAARHVSGMSVVKVLDVNGPVPAARSAASAASARLGACVVDVVSDVTGSSSPPPRTPVATSRMSTSAIAPTGAAIRAHAGQSWTPPRRGLRPPATQRSSSQPVASGATTAAPATVLSSHAVVDWSPDQAVVGGSTGTTGAGGSSSPHGSRIGA